jgi:hypothetical protein
MELEYKAHNDSCFKNVFRINGKEADNDDFGDLIDIAPDDEECEYGCGNMQFIPKESTTKVLYMYGINQEDYNHICDKLKDTLSLGSCGMCE